MASFVGIVLVAILVFFGAVLHIGVLVMLVLIAIVLLVGILGVVLDIVVPPSRPTLPRGSQPRLRFFAYRQAFWRRPTNRLVGAQSARASARTATHARLGFAMAEVKIG
ncbi:MAG: hypothetical protein ACKV19_08735 [Verrucomicrobiales bacterium]